MSVLAQIKSAIEGKSYVYTYSTTKDCPLKHPDIIVYSFLCYRQRHQGNQNEDPPSDYLISRRTGVGRNSIKIAKEKLARMGLLDGLDPRPAPEDWFITRTKSESEHFTDTYSWWKCYVRRTGRDVLLTLNAAGIWSFVLHCLNSGHSPNSGWTIKYLATVLRCNHQTAKNALERLAELGMLSHKVKGNGSGIDLTIHPLPRLVLTQFADSKPFAPSEGGGTLAIADTAMPMTIDLAAKVSERVHGMLRKAGLPDNIETEVFAEHLVKLSTDLDAIQRAIRYAGAQVFLDAEEFRSLVVRALGV